MLPYFMKDVCERNGNARIARIEFERPFEMGSGVIECADACEDRSEIGKRAGVGRLQIDGDQHMSDRAVHVAALHQDHRKRLMRWRMIWDQRERSLEAQ